MVVPGAGGISALALLAVTTLPGLLGGRSSGHEAAGVRADASDATTARLANAPVAGLAADPKLAAKATPVPVAPAATAAASAPAEPAHVVAARTVEPPRAAAPSSPHSSTSAPHHIALAHDAAARGASRTVAHALSGGAAPAAPKLAARAPRVPAEPQPIGHPSTGGGAIEAASHTKTPAGSPQTPAATPRTPTRTPQTSTRTPRTPATPQAPATPKVPAHSGGTATSHPKTSTHPVAAAKPVSTAKPAPKAPAPAPAPPAAGHYVNPLANANVTPERVDQGVDYSGSGTLGAIGNGKVTYVGTSGTGWPGAFIEFKLTDGANAGRYVYYAESITPASGLHVGQTVHAGQPIASIHGGIEIGWASGVGTQPAAQADGQWAGGDDENNKATADGKSFSALIAQLGGPPGKVEG